MSRDITMERTTGIEPAFSAWEADVLPLNYIREQAVRLPSPFGAPPSRGRAEAVDGPVSPLGSQP